MARWCALILLLAAGARPEASTAQRFARELSAHVTDDGRVDYAGWKVDHAGLDAYLKALALPSTSPRPLGALIDGYNALVVKEVLDRYPLKSVRDVPGFFDAITHPVGGEALTLNALEGKIRALGDPRVHFALNCASRSCPRLARRIYEGSRLDELLTARTRVFLKESLKVERVAKTLTVSRLFERYAEDFAAGGGVGAFLAAQDAVPKDVQVPPYRLVYAPYDWSLNDAR